jgi:protein-L-isoaspartate(D-aspartate) O-methyltransferase
MLLLRTLGTTSRQPCRLALGARGSQQQRPFRGAVEHNHNDDRRRLRLKTATQLNFRKRSSSSSNENENENGDMSWRSHGRDNDTLVEALKRNKIVASPRVEVAMKKVDRIFYTKDKDAGIAYQDAPLAIGSAATISAPHMHAYCLELLKDHLKPGKVALDVGSGSGYLTSVFAHMVAPQGKAIGVEHIPHLVEESITNTRSDKNTAPLLKSGVM